MINADNDHSKVKLICGGDSGHEPGSTGFGGCGLLVFASPGARRLYEVMKAFPSKKGTILIRWFKVTISPQIRATKGDISCRQAQADGIEMPIFFQFATISVDRLKGALVGRCALAGTILGMATYFMLRSIVLSFFFLFSSFQNYRRCFRGRLVAFRHFP